MIADSESFSLRNQRSFSSDADLNFLDRGTRFAVSRRSLDMGTLSTYGYRTGAPKEDHDNKARYTDKAPDAGAFEK